MERVWWDCGSSDHCRFARRSITSSTSFASADKSSECEIRRDRLVARAACRLVLRVLVHDGLFDFIETLGVLMLQSALAFELQGTIAR